MAYVIKADGRRERFNRAKVIRTCRKLGASRRMADEVASRIEEEVYDGISTRKILDLIHDYVAELKPAVKHRVDLRTAISRMRPKPDFELFVRTLLEQHGFSVGSERRVRGRCIEYEVDAVASKDGETLFVEVKHHYKPHTKTTLPVCLETKAKLDDLRAGFEDGLNESWFDKALVVCNTKFTQHARRYSECVGIEHIGWNTPKKTSLERLIESSRLYPVALLRDLDQPTLSALSDQGVVLLRELLELGDEEVSKKTGIPLQRSVELRRAAQGISG